MQVDTKAQSAVPHDAKSADGANGTNGHGEKHGDGQKSRYKDDAYFRGKRVHGGTFANTFMYIDEKCNMSCDHCYLGDRLVNHESMTLEEIAKTLDYFKAMGTRKCTIIGGEPTHSEHLFATIKMINERGFECILDTNGWFIAERVLGRIDVNDLEYISFSLDGSTEELHDGNRMKGSYTRVINNIKYAVAKGFEVRIIPSITRKNQHDAESILQLAQKLGVKKVNFHTVTMIGNARPEDDKENQALLPEEWIAFYRKLESIKHKYNVKVWYPPTYAYAEDMERFAAQGYRGCLGRTVDRLSVFPGGSSFICSLMFDEDKAHGGNTNGYYGTMKDGKLTLNPEPTNEINLFFERPDKCIGCSYVDMCHMGCPAERLRGQEGFCGKDKPENKLIPVCRLWKAEVLCD